MTQTTPDAPAQPAPAADILLTLLVVLLTPMFLATSGGDIDCARRAALETINAYRAENHASLIVVALIVAFSMATIGSLSLSLNDDLSPVMAMRARGNANALNRSIELNRRALANLQTAGTTQAVTMTPEDHLKEEAAIAAFTAARQAVAATRTQPPIPNPIPAPAPVQTPVPVPAPVQAPAPPPAQVQTPVPAPVPVQAPVLVQAPVQAQPPAPIQATARPAIAFPASQEKQNRTAWATAITEVAGEFTLSLPFLPPAERKLTSRKIAAMTSSVTALLSNDPLPRLEPGSLGALIQSHAKKPGKSPFRPAGRR
jgi:hypothetical protein